MKRYRSLFGRRRPGCCNAWWLGDVRTALRPAILVGLVPLWLGACSWLDPAEIFGGPTPEPEVIDPTEAEADGPYPSLATVPEERPRPSPAAQRESLTEGLMADRENVRYTQEKLTLATTAVPAAEPPPKTVKDVAGGTAAYTVPRTPDPAPAPPAPVAPLPAAAVTAPDAPPGAPPSGEPAPVLDESGRYALSKGTPQPAPADPGELVGVVYFAERSTDLTQEARKVLEDIVLLQKQRGGVLRVVGHASGSQDPDDPVANQIDKLELSLNRAQNVASAMIDLGARRKALELTALSDTDPDYDETTSAGEAGNRRVEIFLTK